MIVYQLSSLLSKNFGLINTKLEPNDEICENMMLEINKQFFHPKQQTKKWASKFIAKLSILFFHQFFVYESRFFENIWSYLFGKSEIYGIDPRQR